MDEVDLAILRELQEDGRLGLAELGRRVGLTAAPVQRRLRSLHLDGWISNYVALLDPERVRLSFEVFVEIELEAESQQTLELFEDGVRALPEITECHRITGKTHYLLKVVAPDPASFNRFYSEVLLSLPGVLRTTRQVSLSRVKYTTALPLPRTVSEFR